MELAGLRAIGAAQERSALEAKYGSKPEVDWSTLSERVEAPRSFQNHAVTCARSAVPLPPKNDHPRVLVFDGKFSAREGLIGADDSWFDYAWRRSGC